MRSGSGTYAGWLAAALVALTAAGPAAGATTYYVRAGGSDSNDGLTPGTALASVRPAARMLREPGDRLIVGPGTYREGNIAPFGNGTAESPIVLFGDATGAATGDRPGPVLILPDNTPAATSGFYLRGRHDIVIEGFEIAGARDAGIELRTRRRTGAECSGVALRNNRIRGCRRAIQIGAVGNLEVSGNHLIGPLDDSSPRGWVGDGLVMVGTANSKLRPTVTNNRIEDCFIGITGYWLDDAVITDNNIGTRARNLWVGSMGRLTVSKNQFRGPFRCGEVYGTDLTVTDNTFAASVAVSATGNLEVRNNAFTKLGIRRSPARAVIADNTVGELFVGGGGDVEVTRIQGESARGKGIERLTFFDNTFSDLARLRVTGEAEVHDNQVRALTVSATDAMVHDNRVSGPLRVAGDTAEVARNTAAALSVQRRPDLPLASGTSFAVHDNTVAGPLSGLGAATVRVSDNTAAGLLRVVASQTIEVTDNEAQGIACNSSAAGSQVTLTGNRSLHSAGPGLAVIGAEMATIANNVATDSLDSGLVIRRVARIVASDNELSNNEIGGISLRVPPAGDCNENVDVAIDELVTVVGVALQNRPFHDCDAADVNRDRSVTVDEIVLSVGAALGRADPLASTIELRNNRVEDNQRFGINVFARAAVVVAGNRVLRTSGVPLAVRGLGPLSAAQLTGNVLGLGGREGLSVDAVDTATIRDNVVFSNGDAGIVLRAAPGAEVTNNLVYANAGPGIAISVDDPRPSPGARLTNNTIFGNGEWGILVGHGATPSTGTQIRNNVLQHNVGRGIAVEVGALPDLVIAFNDNADGYGPGVFPEATNFTDDPQLVAPAGADGLLGGAGFADDDFHLQPTSPAIDAGSATAAELGITGSAVAGRGTDEGIVDLGYHYGGDDALIHR
jgi:nitrous oxidase accessory protein NosD